MAETIEMTNFIHDIIDKDLENQKYGDKVLAEIEAKEKQEGKQYDGR